VKQRIGKTYKRIIVIVLILTITISSFVLYLHITDDPYMGVKPDVVRMEDHSRPAKGHGSSIRLGNTEFVAGLDLFFYTDEDDKDWDYCTIEVSREIGDTYYVFFERQLDISDIPEEIIKKAEDIIILDKDPRVVTFDEDSGMVTFTIGEKTFTYKLPEN
jgi:hypothetical protein